MKIETNVGLLDIDEKDIIIFKQGLPGFEQLRKFALIALEDTKPIQWLVSLEEKTVSLPVCDPWAIRFDYHINIPENIVSYLDISNEEKLLIMVVVRIPDANPQSMTINLAAPIIINLDNNFALQYISEKSEYKLRHYVKKELERSKKLEEQKDGDD